MLGTQGLVLAAVPTPGASLLGEKVPVPWVMEPGQGDETRLSIPDQTGLLLVVLYSSGSRLRVPLGVHGGTPGGK